MADQSSDEHKNNISVEDYLEDERQDKMTDEVSVNPIEGDYDSPATNSNNPYAPPLPRDHPSMDTNMDRSEVYEEGEEGVAYTPLNPNLTISGNNKPERKVTDE